jgi:hypothetical protein
MQQKRDTTSCFAKLRAISNLFSFFIHPVYINREIRQKTRYHPLITVVTRMGDSKIWIGLTDLV